MDWRREDQHGMEGAKIPGPRQPKYAGGTTSANPGLHPGKQVSFKQVQEVYLVPNHIGQRKTAGIGK